MRNLLVSLATLLYVTVAPLCLPSIIKGIINHLEMRCIFHIPCSTKLTRADGSLASVARAYHDNQVSCLARTEVLAEINIDVFMTKVPGAVW